MKNSKGFTFTETLVAFSVVLMLIGTTLPIITLLKKERSILDARLAVTNALHHELQTYVFTGNGQTSHLYERFIRNTSVMFSFEPTNRYIEGCARWTNEKQTEEKICLYGFVPK